MQPEKTEVLIIGGGATGTGIARDLALRGVRCLLVEMGDLNSGASGANHGLLHSGARYVAKDPDAAVECREEGALLKRMAPHCIEDTGGLFVAVAGDEENYVAEFPGLCAACGIAAEPVDIRDAREMEPALSDRLIAAFRVADAAIDPFRLSMDNLTNALDLGARLRLYTRVTGFRHARGRITGATLESRRSGRQVTVEADLVLNAGGAWAGEIAALAGISIPMIYSKGSLLIANHRISDRVINRLRPSSNADILVPGGTVSILGTTSIRIDSLTDIRPTVEEIDTIVDTAAAMIPELASVRYIRAYAGVRPLVGSGEAEDRQISRGFSLIDHAEQGLENFITITGGKLTTYRRMAEKTADLACRKLGRTAACRTRTDPLPASRDCQWTEPGRAAKAWLKAHDAEDLLLCECEMIPRSVIDDLVEAIHRQGEPALLRALGLRSRIGKGTCQGAFCGMRIAAYLFDREEFSSERGLADLKDFLRGRWKGIRPVLWDSALSQEELQEALHCGLFGLELS